MRQTRNKERFLKILRIRIKKQTAKKRRHYGEKARVKSIHCKQ